MGTVRDDIQVAGTGVGGRLWAVVRSGMRLRAVPAGRSAVAAARSFAARRYRALVREEEGQGTTEYAILVGVLVVIAILAIAVFRDRVQGLWDAIASAINGL